MFLVKTAFQEALSVWEPGNLNLKACQYSLCSLGDKVEEEEMNGE
jgi:hypothetical protein